MKDRMYEDVKTWNVFVGCRFNCKYCKPSFQAQMKRQRKNCSNCYDFFPHEHENRLKSFPKKHSIVWPCGMGDIAFANEEFIRRVIAETKKYPNTTIYWQSKSPVWFNKYLDDFLGNTVLLTTIETNRDADYSNISSAPLPSVRFDAFRNLAYKRKIVTIEPILDFDIDEFYLWMVLIHPEKIYVGYNSHPKNLLLPEPELTKTLAFIKKLRDAGFEVKEKLIREKV